ncbi:uncharacterized protein [Macrobrachium rosenbergii]|uniref:uncharacterized protein n=1 Tax=Macrobrachium rosenbergii TaxID=79674 RepID=UPI0034D6D185
MDELNEVKGRIYLFFFCITVAIAVAADNVSIVATDRRDRNSKYMRDSPTWRQTVPNEADKNSSFAEAERVNKLLSIFTVVVFANVECTVGKKYGFCVTQSQCRDYGGRRIGTCALGFGTCCYKALRSCGGSTSMNITHLQNPDFPASTSDSPQTCVYSITRSPSSCQLRLDFYDFQLSQPDATAASSNQGKCLNDKFTVVSGTSTTTLTYLCGSMPAEWHYYLDVEEASNPTQLQISLTSGISVQRRWNIKVTMVDCARHIPRGCGQYFTGTSGTIYSFNWKSGMYLYGMNYAICFRREKDYCGYNVVDSGPSWIACPDILKIPSTDATTSGFYRYCLTTTSSATNRYPSSITSKYNAPWFMYHYTSQDNPNRAASSGQGPGSSPGFAFVWKATPC